MIKTLNKCSQLVTIKLCKRLPFLILFTIFSVLYFGTSSYAQIGTGSGDGQLQMAQTELQKQLIAAQGAMGGASSTLEKAEKEKAGMDEVSTIADAAFKEAQVEVDKAARAKEVADIDKINSSTAFKEAQTQMKKAEEEVNKLIIVVEKEKEENAKKLRNTNHTIHSVFCLSSLLIIA